VLEREQFHASNSFSQGQIIFKLISHYTKLLKERGRGSKQAILIYLDVGFAISWENFASSAPPAVLMMPWEIFLYGPGRGVQD
jgi:hypothetical protein